VEDGANGTWAVLHAANPTPNSTIATTCAEQFFMEAPAMSLLLYSFETI
jgi:hypothetical protein